MSGVFPPQAESRSASGSGGLRLVVMGVCGAGKSTVSALLAARLGGVYLDADDLHSPANKAKMAAGVPLTDADRAPWLAAVASALASGSASAPAPAPAPAPAAVVIACSALRRVYRDVLAAAVPGRVAFVHLRGSRELVAARLAARSGHYMPPSLLDSQLALCEELAADERGVAVDITPPAAEVAAAALAALAALDAARAAP